MNKSAYLTIDDCPTKDFRAKMDYLSSKKIPAVLFCIGKGLEKYSDEVIYAIKNGFIIGNHSYSHPHFSDIDFEQSKKEIEKTDNIIDRLYYSAGVARPEKLFRFPYGDKGHADTKRQVQNLLRNLDYKQPSNFAFINNTQEHSADDTDCYWTFDTAEWAIYDERCMYGIDCSEKVILRMRQNLFNEKNIILFHDHEETTNIFEEIIEEYISLGIKFSLPPLNV